MAVNGITTLGNRTFLFGGASGIDTSALITAAYNQRKAEADKIDIQVTKNTDKYNAYEQIRTLATSVQTSLSSIKKNYSVLTSTGLFDQRTGTLSTPNSSSNLANLVSVSIDPGTDLGSYEIKVLSKAKEHKVGSATTFTDQNADLGYTGTFDIAIAGKTAATINVGSTTSLLELATAINAQSTTTGVKASVAQISGTNFQLILTGTDTAKNISVTNITGTNVLQSIGVTSGGSTFINVIQGAQQAEISVDGVSYLRDTNNFDDVIPGVNLTVKNSDPATVIDLSIENDNSGIKTGIQAFIEAYNSLRDYIKSQQVVSESGEVSSSVSLFGDALLGNINLSVQSLLGKGYGSGGTTLSTLREAGITLDLDNKLVIDEAVFDTALIDKFDEVRGIFETSITSSNSELRVSANTSTAGPLSFVLDITHSGSAITNVSVGGDNTLFDISGSSIIGKAGTVYEGITLAYVGTTSTSVSVSIDDGVADTLDATLNRFSDILNGDLSKELLRISTQNTQLLARSARVLERADAFRENLINKYAGYEAKIAQAQTTLAQLQSLLGITNNNNN